MRKVMTAMLLAALATGAQAGKVKGTIDKLTRLDCGTIHVNNLNAFSDTMSYAGQSRDIVASCYLIQVGQAYMLWDTGLAVAVKDQPNDLSKPMSPTLRKTIVEQLAELGIKPEQIGLIGISHYHGDHVGQAVDFPKAKLMIGVGDLAYLRSNAAAGKPLANWLGEGAKVEGVEGDKDLFKDGSVTMISLPGHTPGHHGLLVKLPKTGYVLLSGDVAHFRENLDSDGVPPFNTERADSLASMDRFRKLAKSLKAVAIIQHDPRDVAKLPAFPAGAE